MIMATHQMDFARALASDILFMEQGRIIEQGSPDELLAPGSGTRTSDFCGKLFDMRGPTTLASGLVERIGEPTTTVTHEAGRTSRKGVWAGGDIVTGAATVILAMGAGKRAAAAILQDHP